MGNVFGCGVAGLLMIVAMAINVASAAFAINCLFSHETWWALAATVVSIISGNFSFLGDIVMAGLSLAWIINIGSCVFG